MRGDMSRGADRHPGAHMTRLDSKDDAQCPKATHP